MDSRDAPIIVMQGSWLSKLLFNWISPLLKLGWRKPIENEDIPLLTPQMSVEMQYRKWGTIFYGRQWGIGQKMPTEELPFPEQSDNKYGIRLALSLFKANKSETIICSVLLFLLIFISMSLPVLTNQVILYVSSGQKDPTSGRPWILLGLLAASVTSRLLLECHISYLLGILGYTFSNVVNLAVYEKAMRTQTLCQKDCSAGEVINYCQSDCQRLSHFSWQVQTVIQTPIELAIGIYLLWSYIGIIFLGGLAVIVGILLVTFNITRKSSKVNDLLNKAKEKRVKFTEEMLSSMRSIKINALEKPFFHRLNALRQKELSYTRQTNMYGVYSIFILWLASPLVLFVTFMLYNYVNGNIGPTQAFTTIILFRILQYPLRQFPPAFAAILQIWSSIKRLGKFLLKPEINEDHIRRGLSLGKDAVVIENGTYLWEKEKEEKNDKDSKEKDSINTGKDQDGKGSLIKIHSEEFKDSSKLESETKPKPSSNGPRPTNDSILSDSTLTEPLIAQTEALPAVQDAKQDKYLTALSNINITFPKQTLTMILGDIGCGKSSLLYSIMNETKPVGTAMVYIDGTVGFAAQKAWIICGTVKENIIMTLPFDQDKYKKALHYSNLTKDLEMLPAGDKTQIGEKGVTLSGGQKARIGLARVLYHDADIMLLDDIISAVDVHVGQFLLTETVRQYLMGRGKTVVLPTHAIKFAPLADRLIIMSQGRIIKVGSTPQVMVSPQFASLQKTESEKATKGKGESQQEQITTVDKINLIKEAVFEQTKTKDNSDGNETVPTSMTDRVVQDLMLAEDRSYGSVKKEVYQYYIDLNGGKTFVAILLFSMSMWQIFVTVGNIQIEQWCEDPDNNIWHLYLYGALSISSSFFMFIRAYTLVIGGVKQGTKAHKKMSKALLYASQPLFYERVPAGRILNRLTKDLIELDQSIGYSVGGILVETFSLISNLVICAYASTPLILVAFIPIAYASFRIRRYYMKAQRELVRLETMSATPIVSGIISSVHGAPSLRTFGLTEDFTRLQMGRIDFNQRARLSRQGLQIWFCLRLSSFGQIINIGAIAYSILSSSTNSSMAGLLLGYAIGLCDDIVWLFLQLCTLENQMISLERIQRIMMIEPEAGYAKYVEDWWTKEEGWNKVIHKGEVVLENVSVRYRPDLPCILRNVTLKINAGDKIGIVGRTGAGKSTLINVLLRILDPCEGRVLVDGRDISEFPLKDYRSSITMIDQQPCLLSGTFRNNLNPAGLYKEEELLKVLEECNLLNVVNQKGGLDSKVGQDSLSVGEKQLLSICKALLKTSGLVLIDEATANIDVRNDEIIQGVIGSKFTGSTVLTIAHRLSTLENSDKILVLDAGQVVQFGTPQELLANPNGVYSKMINKNQVQYLT